MLNELSVKDFVKEVASDSPAPGGGSVAALSAALGAGLISMLANLTINKAGYEAADAQMREIAAKTGKMSQEFVLAIDEDSKAFDKYMEAMKLAKNTDQEKKVRSEAMQKAAQGAALVPLGLAKKAYSLVETAEFCIKNGNKNATSDGMVALQMLRSAVLGAIYNVKINLGMIKDEQFKADIQKEIQPLEVAVNKREGEILSSVVL